MKNILYYPMKNMRIVQNYNGKFSHYNYSHGNPPDYPIDDAGKDSGRDWFYCPCDKMKVVKISGVGNGYTNAVFLQSTSKVYFADGTKNYVSIIVVHPNDSDFARGRIKVGMTFKRGEEIVREGTDGHATGNHVHIAVGKGKFTSSYWASNSKGKFTIRTTGGAKHPENAFVVDKKFTTIRDTGDLKWRTVVASVNIKTYPRKNVFKGSKDSVNVKRLQWCLNKILDIDLKIDGKFGEATEKALKKFQKKYNLAVDGLCGSKSRAKIKKLI